MFQAKNHIVLISLSTGGGRSSTGVPLNHSAATRRRTYDHHTTSRTKGYRERYQRSPQPCNRANWRGSEEEPFRQIALTLSTRRVFHPLWETGQLCRRPGLCVYLHLLDPPFANQLDTCSQMTWSPTAQLFRLVYDSREKSWELNQEAEASRVISDVSDASTDAFEVMTPTYW